MSVIAVSLFWAFLVLMAIGVPIAFVLLIAPAIGLTAGDKTAMFKLLMPRLYNGVAAFPLLAVPFFMLAGEIMNKAGITASLVTFARAFVGHLRAGLVQVTVVSAMIFSGISGSAVADCSALGKMLIPAMDKAGYNRAFAAAVVAAASVLGPIIPPSGLMILYAFVMNQSVGALFAAGLLPGIVFGSAMMLVAAVMSKRWNLPQDAHKATWPERWQATKGAVWTLLMPVILLGGIFSGYFTPTEAAVIAVLYALVIGMAVLRTVKWGDLPEILYETAKGTGVVLFMVGAAVAFSTVVSISGLPQQIAGSMVAITKDKYLLLFIINVMLFIVGMLLDAGPAILILGPILSPVLEAVGVDPLHFAVVMCVNMSIGLITPPMGLVLFVSSSVSGEKIERIVQRIWPFLICHVAILLLLSYVPWISLVVPRLLGFIQ
jgi:TRAP-type transport system large permease protein